MKIIANQILRQGLSREIRSGAGLFMAWFLFHFQKILIMNNFFRTIIAGYGAKKLGGGCLSTILVFIVIYYALGTCNKTPVQTAPQNHSSIEVRDHHPPDVSYLPGTSYALSLKQG